MSSSEEQGQGLYEFLELNRGASPEEIERAYQRIISFLEPGSLAMYSIGDEEVVDAQRRRVEEAYRILGDPERRAAYDRNPLDADSYPSLMVPREESGISSTIGHVDDPESTVGTSAPATSVHDAHTTPPRPASGKPSPTSKRSPRIPLGSTVRSRPSPAKAPTQPKILPADAVQQPGRRRLAPTIDLPAFTSTSEINGGMFKSLRESADASLADVAAITKISRRYLRAIEENDFDALPAQVYVRGFVREYARVLGLDPKEVTAGYMRIFDRYRAEKRD